MRTAPPPLRPAPRQAAAQVSTQSPTSAVVKRGNAYRGTDGKWLNDYQDWQGWARRYARQIGAASFSAGVIADCCARCDLQIEERINGEWHRSEDPRFVGIMDEYRNALQTVDELIRLHAWHYQVAGEMLQTQRDGDYGVEYGIHSMAAAEWNRPSDGYVLVKLVPDGKVDKETAFAIPREQAIRFWVPDQEWFAYATSPMAASIDDLRRLRALSRYAWRTAESALAMNGLLWAPGEAFEGPPPETDTMPDEQLGEIKNIVEQAYYDAANLRLRDDEDVAAIAPHLVHWDKEFGQPVWIKLGDGLDANGIAHRKEALEDFARGSNLPVTTVIGGGVGDANHWSEWLASEKFFDSGVAPTMDRILYLDLTRTFLWPRAKLAGLRPDQLANLRIGYDPTPVIIAKDNGAASIELWKAGLLDDVPTLEANGYNAEDLLVDPAKRQWLLEVLAHGRLANQPAVSGPEKVPIGPSTVVQAPPTQPTTPPALGASARLGYSEDQQRDELGRFGEGSGNAKSNGKRTKMTEVTGTGTKDDPITGLRSADEALAAIAAGKYVEMDPDMVAVSLEKLAAISKDARDKGEAAQVYDLCNITSSDKSLFCGSSVVESRLDMPQLSGHPLPGSPAATLPTNSKGEVDITHGFTESLAKEGVKSHNAEVDPATLKASQNDLNGTKVAGMMNAIANGTMPPGTIMVSSDNYVIDGHHRWAAQVGTDYTGGGQLTMPVVRIDLPIQQVLDRAKSYAKEQGIPQASIGAVSRSRVAAVLAEALLSVVDRGELVQV